MKIIFMGTPDFSTAALEALCEAGYEVTAVVTQPDRPKGRGKTLQPAPVKVTALRLGIPVLQPQRVREELFLDQIGEMAPDMIVVSAFGQIIPKRLLDLPRYGCINIHASLLPAYRGAAPIQRAVIDGQAESGVTIMRMDEGLDTGDMIAQVAVPISADETGGSLFNKLSRAGAGLLIDTIPKIVDGTAVYEKQPEESPTSYAAMIRKADGRIDWSRPALEIERFVRGMTPWPAAYTGLNGRMLKIWRTSVEPQESTAIPGTVLRADKEGIRVQTGDGVLCIHELQLEGKKRMEADAFLRGCPVSEGTVLKPKE